MCMQAYGHVLYMVMPAAACRRAHKVCLAWPDPSWKRGRTTGEMAKGKARWCSQVVMTTWEDHIWHP
jgi:hypothetical protein